VTPVCDDSEFNFAVEKTTENLGTEIARCSGRILDAGFIKITCEPIAVGCGLQALGTSIPWQALSLAL